MKDDFLIKYVKFFVGFVVWIPSSYFWADRAHIAPAGVYDGTGSSLEIISMLFMLTFFIGIPIATWHWMFRAAK